MRLLLIRHGESSANAERRLQGHLDVPLSEHGRHESGQLARRLTGLPIAGLYTSPLRRARETAEILARQLRLPMEKRSDLMERDVGELAGLSHDEIRVTYPAYVHARAEGRTRVSVAGYESDEHLSQRVMRGLETIVESHPRETVAVVTHAGVIAAFARQALSTPIVRPGPFAISNASITIFDVGNGGSEGRARPHVQLITLNDTCHLDGAT